MVYIIQIVYVGWKHFIPLLSYDIASESKIPPCIKIDKPLVVYRFSGNVIKMTLLMPRIWQNPNIFTQKYNFKMILNRI